MNAVRNMLTSAQEENLALVPVARRKVQRKVHAKMLLNAFGVNFLFA